MQPAKDMKTILDRATRDEIIRRINTLDDFMHPFFGKITREQIGYLAYKHDDHHLRQFNA